MKQIIKIIRKVDIERQYKFILHLDQDYWLSSLYQAMQANDEAEKIRCKVHLKRLQQELDSLERTV
ncbi:MAG: hypothetical protein ABS939_02645 [Psychrobacillus sp.]